MELILADNITIVVSFILLVFNFRRLFDSTRYIIYLIFFLFYVLPLFLDAFFQIPTYDLSTAPGFLDAAEDPKVRILYDLSIIYSQIIILYYKKGTYVKSFLDDVDFKFSNNKATPVFFIGMVLPLLLVPLITSDISIIYTFQWREIDRTVPSNFTLLEHLSYVGITCSVLLLFNQKKLPLLVRLISIVFIYINICIEGKRSILFFALLNIIILLYPGLKKYYREQRERKRLELYFLLGCGVVAAILIAFSVFVKVTSRGYGLDASDAIYTTLRIDFLRDDRVRYAIYSLLYPEKVHILDYYGQSLLPLLFWVYPINWIVGFLSSSYFYSYSHCISSALEGAKNSPDLVWMTPSIFAEFVSNFNFIGVLIIPFFSLWFAKLASNRPYPINVLIIICYILLQMYAESYIMLYIEFVLIFSLLSLTKKRYNVIKQ